LLRDDGVPLVGPFTLDPGDAFLDSTAFYLYPGLSDQARALADRAVDTTNGAEAVVVVAPANEHSGGPVAAIEDQFRKRRGAEPVVVRYAEGEYDAAAVGEQIGDARKVIFLGDQGELESLLTLLAERDTQPEIYTLSSLVTRPLFAAPAEFDKLIFLAYPTYFSDVTAKGRADYIDLAERHALPPDHLQAQIVALASARLFVEGLQRAGRELSRSRFVGALEALYAFQTGLTPPLSYGPNRRIGARGAHIVAVDLVNHSYAVVDGGWRDVR
jgi:ABC-type branched-subunit amino acid transport system substrate-binding protein